MAQVFSGVSTGRVFLRHLGKGWRTTEGVAV